MIDLQRVSDASAYPGLTAEEVSDLTAIETGPETMVQQQFKDEVDVNTILKRFGAGVALWRVGSPQGFYADFRDVMDYDSAVAKVDDVNRRFMALPVELREKYDNSPGKLVDAISGMSEEDFAALMESVKPKVDDPPPPTDVVS